MSLAQNYAKVLAEGADVAKTVAYMKTKGHLSLLPQVARALERGRKKGDTVTVGREADVAAAKKKFPGAAVTVDPKVVGGYFALRGATLIDATYRRALVAIYKNAVN